MLARMPSDLVGVALWRMQRAVMLESFFGVPAVAFSVRAGARARVRERLLGS